MHEEMLPLLILCIVDFVLLFHNRSIFWATSPMKRMKTKRINKCDIDTEHWLITINRKYIILKRNKRTRMWQPKGQACFITFCNLWSLLLSYSSKKINAIILWIECYNQYFLNKESNTAVQSVYSNYFKRFIWMKFEFIEQISYAPICNQYRNL